MQIFFLKPWLYEKLQTQKKFIGTAYFDSPAQLLIIKLLCRTTFVKFGIILHILRLVLYNSNKGLSLQYLPQYFFKLGEPHGPSPFNCNYSLIR